MQEGLGVETTIDTNKSVFPASVECKSKKDAEAILILTRFCQSAVFHCVSFYEWEEGDMEAEGWTALGKALFQLHNKVAGFRCFKSQMGDAKMEDVKVIWDCLSEEWTLSLGEGDEIFYKDRGGDGWLALEKCLSMTDDVGVGNVHFS